MSEPRIYADPRGNQEATRLLQQAGSANLYDVVEAESRRIAQRLHDESSQMLAVVYMELAELSHRQPDDLPVRISHIVEHLDEVREQLRHLSHELRPVALDRLGLLPALNFLAEGAAARYGLAVKIVNSYADSLGQSIETAIYRTVQESLSNVSKHAMASHVEIHLYRHGESIVCAISDDGVGFPEGQCDGSSWTGLGLIGIRERVHALNGRCSIMSRNGVGSTIKVSIPL